MVDIIPGIYALEVPGATLVIGGRGLFIGVELVSDRQSKAYETERVEKFTKATSAHVRTS